MNGLKVLKENKMKKLLINERIRELVRQAGLDDADFPIEDWDNVPLARYTELIVRECMKLITIEHTALDLPEYNLGILEGYRRGRESMNIYFGIGE